jgi:hypothetical protein
VEKKARLTVHVYISTEEMTHCRKSMLFYMIKKHCAGVATYYLQELCSEMLVIGVLLTHVHSGNLQVRSTAASKYLTFCNLMVFYPSGRMLMYTFLYLNHDMMNSHITIQLVVKHQKPILGESYLIHEYDQNI